MVRPRPVVIGLILVVWAALATVAGAQQNAVSPDRLAFRAARLLDDPQAQLDALRKVAADHPTTLSGERSRLAVLDILVKHFPTRVREITSQFDAIMDPVKKQERWMKWDDIAYTLVGAGVMLDRARSYAEKAIGQFKEKDFIKNELREYAEAKMPPPEEPRLRRTYQRIRGELLTTLARIQLKQGRVEEANRIFTEANGLFPTFAPALSGLGTIAARAGQEDVAYDAFLRARLTGVLEADQQRTFEQLFKQRHGGSLAGFETSLDNIYRETFKNPIQVTSYSRQGPSNHTVLVEVFTGAGCPPCAAADLAVDSVMERYNARDVIVLMHHQHVPRPDPMTNLDTVARAASYNVTSVPTIIVDGSSRVGGGGDREDAPRSYERLTEAIEKALDPTPALDARLSLSGTLEGSHLRVRVEATSPADPPNELRLRVALVENHLRYGGENGIRFHPMVVRAITEGAVLPAGVSTTVEESFDVAAIAGKLKAYLDEFEIRNDRFGPITFVEKKDAIDFGGLTLVAFIQDGVDHRVLQSARGGIEHDRRRLSQ